MDVSEDVAGVPAHKINQMVLALLLISCFLLQTILIFLEFSMKESWM
jgi:hypothetical protein